MNYQTKFYIALDVHTKKTQYAVRTWEGDMLLDGYCASMYKDLKDILEPYFHSCVVGMEACSGFYPLREGFMHDGVEVKIANVLRIRQLIVKNDKLDARRLSDMLRLGTFPESFIPSKEIQEMRDLVTVRHSFLKQLNSAQSRIWATLTRKGLKIPERSIFSKKGLTHLNLIIKEGKCGSDLKFLFTHYQNVAMSLEQSTNELIEYAKSNFPEEWKKLQDINGIGPLVSSYTIANVHPISRFENKKKLRRYAGVIPCFQESAGKFHGSFLPKTSSRALLRWALTQAAHGAIRTKNSKLSLYYKSKKKDKKQKAIMAVARSVCDLVFMKLNE
ncbi:hypothetical protein CMO93_06220 [Candidatus Woesearchaeota archaeon]|nr:hypothetical protein [Candidatus Woesearchaeota archaeon]